MPQPVRRPANRHYLQSHSGRRGLYWLSTALRKEGNCRTM